MNRTLRKLVASGGLFAAAAALTTQEVKAMYSCDDERWLCIEGYGGIWLEGSGPDPNTHSFGCERDEPYGDYGGYCYVS
jgi:hypothetical protein